MSDEKPPAPYSKGWRVPKEGHFTRGTPIERVSHINVSEAVIVEKLNELIDRINAMNEVYR